MPCRSLVALLLAGVPWVAGAQVSADTLGLKVPDADEAWPRWQGRMQALAATSWWWRPSPLDGHDAPGQRLESFSLLGDYYFLRNAPGLRARGGFRATSGLIIGTPTNRVLSGYGQGPGGPGLSARALAAGMAGSADASGAATTVPYLGVGYSSASERGGWGFSADVGLVARSPGSAVKLGRVFSGNQPLDDLLREMRLSPLLNVGVSYSF
ncbi:MAG: hypothetical protein JNM26_18615 [Ideonella sp.]|nr:hypothetical protein [Ideonella sp.]